MENKKIYCFVSSWLTTYGGNDGNGGIHVFRMAEDGSLEKTDRVSDELAIGYVASSPDGKYLYGINETKKFSNMDVYGGSVNAYSFDPEKGKLKFVNNTPTVGVFPCFLTITHDGKYLLATNYGSVDTLVRSQKNENGGYTLQNIYDEGSVVLIPVGEDGKVQPVSSLQVHTETSVDPIRQIAVHPHSVNVDNTDQFAMVCDRGGDRIYSYRINREKNELELCDVFRTKAGTGPRHLAFHPTKPYFYVVSELLPMIASYKYDTETGKIEEINMISTEPENYKPRDYSNFGACTHPADVHVHPNGKYVYASNRGHNSIATFAVADDGALSFVTYMPSHGDTPRAFNFDPTGKFMFVTNQDSGNILTYRLGDDGTLEATGSVAYADQPVCIKFAEF